MDWIRTGANNAYHHVHFHDDRFNQHYETRIPWLIIGMDYKRYQHYDNGFVLCVLLLS